jgi:hypothetical protein
VGTGRPVPTAAAPPSAGVILLVFGVLGSADRLDFFGTTGSGIAGLSGNGLPSPISVTAGTLPVIGAVVGGGVASTLDMTVGALFILGGSVGLALLETSADIPAFRMPDVIFGFVMGLFIPAFGMYGRISGEPPHGDTYWLRRHPEQAAAEEERRCRPAAAGIGAPGRTPEALGARGPARTGPL